MRKIPIKTLLNCQLWLGVATSAVTLLNLFTAFAKEQSVWPYWGILLSVGIAMSILLFRDLKLSSEIIPFDKLTAIKLISCVGTMAFSLIALSKAI